MNKKLKSNCVFHKIFVVHCLLLQLIKVEAQLVVEVVIHQLMMLFLLLLLKLKHNWHSALKY